ncbi:hypothetical protein SDC9_60843 [bioreactor metagenome]|uniref:Uncharacterized protein n=1 Tax=bioreactor metagenome TaxID=1076179 RepID=A0A644XE24_9ZZZZ
MNDLNQLLKRTVAVFCTFALLSTLSFAAEKHQPETAHGSLWLQTATGILVNGVELGVVSDNTQYQWLPYVDGTVYIPLRTVEELLGAESTWDETTAVLSLERTHKPYVRENRVDITKVEQSEEEINQRIEQYRQDRQMGIDVELRPDITLLLDGVERVLTNAQDEAIYPMVFRDVFYLPIRGVAELCDMEVIWLPGEPVVFSELAQHSFSQLYESYVPVGQGSQIHLYNTPTEAQLKSVRDYLKTANELYMQCVDATAAFPDTSVWTTEQAIAQLEVIASYGEQLRTLSAPDAPFFAWEVTRFRSIVWTDLLYRIVRYIDLLESEIASVETILPDFKDLYMLTALYTLRGQLEEGQRLLDAVKAGN